MVCTGAKSERQAKTAINKVVRELKDNGILMVGRPIIQVVNIVASVSLGGRIDLEKAVHHLGRTMYEPEQFPGLVYRISDPKVVVLLFGSGKLVCTGARRPEDVEAAVDKITDELKAAGLLH